MEAVWRGSSFQGLFNLFLSLFAHWRPQNTEHTGWKPVFQTYKFKGELLQWKSKEKYVILPFSCILLKICQFGAKSLNPSLPPFDNHRVRVNTSMTFHSGRGITFMSFHDHSIWRHMPCRFLENFKIWYFLLFCSVYKGASCKIVFFYGDKHFSV